MKKIQQLFGIGLLSMVTAFGADAQNGLGVSDDPILGTYPKIGIVEGSSTSNFIEGVIYLDTDKNCGYQSTEETLEGVFVQATNLITGEVQSGTTAANGSYSIAVEEGRYRIEVKLPSPYYKLSCQSESILDFSSVGETKSANLGLVATVTCAFLDVKIDAPLLHSTDASSYTVSYCNHGTAEAEDSYIRLVLDDYLTVEGSTHPIASQEGNTYIFELGTIDKGACDQFELNVQVDAKAIEGQNHCTNVAIYPDNICDPAVKGVRHDLVNNDHGEAIHVLGTGRDFIFEDNVILRSDNNTEAMDIGPVILGSEQGGGSSSSTNPVTITIPTNTSTNVAVTNNSQTNSTSNNGSGWTTDEINSFYEELSMNFPEDDRFSAEDCQANTSFYNSIEINNTSNNNSNSNSNTGGSSSNSTNDDNETGTTTNSATTNSISGEDNDDESAIKKILEHEDSDEIEVQVNVMPNPFFDKATIVVKGGTYEQLTLEVLNVAGQEVRQLQMTNNQVQFSREDLSRGMYIYRIKGDGAMIHSGKLLIR
ncbi:MAG: T9SS type A sorting domain-containing protein [Aureispira sp.]|nr:T9SS type A sorting domain-containing protein [Aureispira sp.]